MTSAIQFTPNFMFFNYRDFSFHNYGYVFTKECQSTYTDALDCSPDTDAAIQDALEEIIKELHEVLFKKDIAIETEKLSFFTDSKFWNCLFTTDKAKIPQYYQHISQNIDLFAAKKHRESKELCRAIFNALLEKNNLQAFNQTVKERFDAFFKKEDIDDALKKYWEFKYFLVLLRSIPQPWNDLGSGAIFKYLISGALDNINLLPNAKALMIKDLFKIEPEKNIPTEYEHIKKLQLGLESAFIFNASFENGKTSSQQQSAVVYPLIDNGFLRGCFYLLPPPAENHSSKAIDYSIYTNKTPHFVEAIKSSHETEMMYRLTKARGSDIYKRMLNNLHYIQEISLGSLWRVDGGSIRNDHVTGYGRRFKNSEDDGIGIYWYRSYENYEEFLKIKRKNGHKNNSPEEEERKLVTTICKDFKTKSDFYYKYPQISSLNNFNTEKINALASGSYYNQSGLDIKWRLILPVVQGGKLEAVYFLYYRDPIVWVQNKFIGLSVIGDNPETTKNREAKTIFGARARQIMKIFSAINAQKEILKHSTKSAMVSINVRNLSHNICSHVLAYWIQKLANVNTFDSLKAINKSKALFRYIQHRADYLAEVATSIPCSEMSFDIEKDIFAPFVADLEPYNTYANNAQGGLPLDTNVYVLLEGIAKSEGILINFGTDTEQEKVKKITLEIDKSLKENNVNKPIYVSIPSGVIGKHAIYSILENFIRNEAKHYKGASSDESFINIRIYQPEKWKEDYIAVDFIDVRDNSCSCDIVKTLKDFINGSFVRDDGGLKPGGWGIKEMLISANFLRKNTHEDLYDIITNNKECAPPLLDIRCDSTLQNESCDNKNCCKDCKYKYNLAITFYLKKPKHLAVMTDKIEEDKIKKDIFEIKKIKKDEFANKPIPHNILLVDKSEYDSYKSNPLAPCRVMVVDSEIDSEIDDECYLCLYEKFIEDSILRKKEKLPKIVNDLESSYNFKSNEYALDCYENGDGSNNASGNIVFKNHPEKDTIKTAFEESLFFQPISNGFSTKARFHNNKEFPDLMRDHFYLELIEAALTKVVIVDERISKWADENSKYNFGMQSAKKQREILEKMGLYVPQIVKEDTYNLENLKGKLGALKVKVLESQNVADAAHFFVIHQGILDKLCVDVDNFMGEIKCRWKVIDSGRGVPEKMNYRFVQISALLTLLENYDKHGLVQTLFSLRKPVREEI